jgi:hypothetical protein
LTLRGGAQVEAGLRAVLESAADRVAAVAPAGSVRALVLLGGYGRGEGGVLVEGGRERPHNNLDLLLAARGLDAGTRAELKLKLDEALEQVAREAQVGIDLSVHDDTALARDECRVIWYDARHGHKTLLGDVSFLPGLRQFSVERIPATDALDLLVNRGTLLLINELLVARDPASPATRRNVVKHAAKAVIGYGDALLFFLGAYHWSYAERQRRMAARGDVDAGFRRLYDDAMEFRFRPDYAGFAPQDLAAWGVALRAALEPVHLRVERLRLGDPELGWAGYPERALCHALVEGGLSTRPLARRVRNLLRGGRGAGAGSPLARLGYRGLGPGSALRALYPVLAYRLAGERDRHVVTAALEAASDGQLPLVRAYLRAWGRHRDFNLEAGLRRMGLRLEEAQWA